MNKLYSILARRRILVFTLLDPFYKFLYKKRTIQLVAKRANLKSDQVNELCQDIKWREYVSFTSEVEKFNDYYGIASALKDYARVPDDFVIKSHIEHAPGMNDFMYSGELNCSYRSIIMTGYFREKVLRQNGIKKDIFRIGPYINYARSILSEQEFAKEKKRLGRNLLVFPAHSTHFIAAEYDIESLCKKMIYLKRAKKFDSIRVCLYWKDIDKADFYREKGFEVVSAGHMFDPLFLSRLRSLIELSDVTVSNVIGSQLPYSISLGKPHYLFAQEIKKTDSKNEYTPGFMKDLNKKHQSLYELFGKYSDQISDRQKEVLNEYAGFDQLKTPQELREILLSTNARPKKRFIFSQERRWGFDKILRKYARFPGYLPFPAHPEHGWTIFTEPLKSDLITKPDLMFVFNKRRLEGWKTKSNIPTRIMGSPFIHYKNMKKITQDKNAQGTIAFPCHSTYTTRVDYSIEKYCQDLKKLPQQFQPITVCLFWLDYIKPDKKIYEQYGFKVVTAGPKFFSSFDFVKKFYRTLRKYKYSTSNEVGNYTFFAVDLGIPFFLLGEETAVVNLGKDINVQGEWRTKQTPAGRRAAELFSTGPITKISGSQKKYVREEAGLDDCLSPVQMRKVLMEFSNKSNPSVIDKLRYLIVNFAADLVFNGPWIRILIKQRLKKN